jgi:hypothetical protein
MKAIPYLLSGVLVAPGVLFAYFVWTMTQAIRQENFFKFLFYLLVQAVRMLEWGFGIVLLVVVAWIALAFVPKYRWLGALGMGVLAVVSLIEIFAATGPPKSLDDLSFPMLSVIGLALNAWLVWDGLPASAVVK